MYLDLLSHRPSRRHLAAKAFRVKTAQAWRRRKSGALAALAGLVLMLAIAGYRIHGDSVFESLYMAPQLFALGAGIGQGYNVYLQVARFLGPFVLGYAFLGAVFAMYRQQLNRFVIRHLRRHIVIAGLGAAGYRLAKAFAAEGWPVVALERDPANSSIAGGRERGVRVLVGDATDPQLLCQAGLPEAVLLVALCGDDRVNIDVTAAARAVSSRQRSQVLTALAGFDDFDLWHVLKAPALVDRDQAAFRLELVNLWALAAELLLEQYPPFRKSGPGSPHVVVASDEGLAESLLVGILRRWLAAERRPGDFLRLSLAVASPRVLADLAVRNPELEEVPACHLDTWEGWPLEGAPPGTTDAALRDGPAPRPGPARSTPNTVYVALASETAALTTALTLRQHSLGSSEETQIVVVVEDDEAGVAHAIRRGGTALQGVHAFGWLSRTLHPAALLENTATEVMARLGHKLHCEQQHALGLGEHEDPSLVPWEDLPHGLRESNRLWADGIATKLASLQCVVMPAPLLDPERLAFRFTEAEMEKLAPFEHERWSTDMKRMGYRPGPRDASHHPLIDVPFEELPESNKEKDRAHVRVIPHVLARAGFRIERRPGGAEEHPAHGQAVAARAPGERASGERELYN